MATHTITHRARKYEPLTAFLMRQSEDVLRISFHEIERVIGATLPKSARDHRAWWSNNPDNNVMTKAWIDAGFESEEVDMERGHLTFRRVRREASGDAGAPSVPATTGERHPVIGWMKGTLTIVEGVDLTEPADPEWGEAAYGDRMEEAQ